MIVVSVALLLIAAVLLVLSLGEDSLAWLYAAIGASLGSLAVLAAHVVTRRRRS